MPQIESYKKTPLYEAAVQNNFVDIKKILLNPQDPKNGIFELFWFIKEGNIQGIKNLLDCGVLQELQDTKKLAGLAFYAIQSDSKNKIAILDLILDRGANIESLNFSFDSLLQTAIETEQGEIVKHLLAKGADINTVKIDKISDSMKACLKQSQTTNIFSTKEKVQRIMLMGSTAALALGGGKFSLHYHIWSCIGC